MASKLGENWNEEKTKAGHEGGLSANILLDFLGTHHTPTLQRRFILPRRSPDMTPSWHCQETDARALTISAGRYTVAPEKYILNTCLNAHARHPPHF